MSKDSLQKALDRLEKGACCGYSGQTPVATEPTAIAAMALTVHGRSAAEQAVRWLVGRQNADGSLGTDDHQRSPGWPTGWAVLAWTLSKQATVAVQRAVNWILTIKSKGEPRSPIFGHDPSLSAWPWVEGTHAWVEPTAINLLALKHFGLGSHPRCEEAVAVLLDRCLQGGGWNFGNTTVFGSPLPANVQATGLALAALGDEPKAADPVRRSLAHLTREVSDRTTPVSLAYALLGGGVHGWRPPRAEAWIEAAVQRVLDRGAAPYPLALLALASATANPWRVSRSGKRRSQES